MARLEPTSGFNFLMFVLVASSSLCAQGRIHHLELQNDRRGQVRLMSFGFHRGGYLEVNLTKFAPLFDKRKFGARTFGFSLYQGRNDGLSSYLDEGSSNCVLRNRGKDPITLLTFNFTKSRVIIQPPVNQTGGNLAIYSQKPGEDLPLNGTSKQKPLNSTKTKSIINKETVGNTELPLLKVNGSYHTQFYVRMDKDEHIGLYTLFFHSCEEGKQSAPSPIPFNLGAIFNDSNFIQLTLNFNRICISDQ
uniref:Legume lectin domain-containing protein n=1 Tax=Eptatretus burgeri TaxID=7764 RepID=A0A8C4N8S6_EPTBU